MGEVKIEKVVVQEAADQNAGDGSGEAQQNGLEALYLAHRRPGAPNLVEEQDEDHQEHGQSDEAHFFGHQ